MIKETSQILLLKTDAEISWKDSPSQHVVYESGFSNLLDSRFLKLIKINEAFKDLQFMWVIFYQHLLY